MSGTKHPVDDVLDAHAVLKDAFKALGREAEGLGYAALVGMHGVWVSLPTRDRRDELLCWCMGGDPTALRETGKPRPLSPDDLRDLPTLLPQLVQALREQRLADAAMLEERAARLRGGS